MRRAEGWAATAYLALSLVLLAGWGLSARGGGGVAGPEPSEAEFRAQWQAMVGQGGDGAAVRVSGDDVWLLARRWEFTPALLVAPDHRYRFHFLAEDVTHSAAIGGVELLLPPGQVRTVVLTTPHDGRLALQCGEYCGLSHSRMTGTIEVGR